MSKCQAFIFFEILYIFHLIHLCWHKCSFWHKKWEVIFKASQMRYVFWMHRLSEKEIAEHAESICKKQKSLLSQSNKVQIYSNFSMAQKDFCIQFYVIFSLVFILVFITVFYRWSLFKHNMLWMENQ